MLRNSEFTVPNAYQYNQSRTWRWILSHVLRYWHFALISVVSYVVGWIAFAQARVVIGQAVEVMLSPDVSGTLLNIALLVFILLATDGLCMLLGSLMAENVAVRFETDARQELYISLLGKSKTFHDRQRVGDIMARATDDTQQLSNMIVPGTTLLLEVVLGFVVPIAFIASVNLELIIAPVLFVVAYIVAVRVYLRKLNPAVKGQREHFGKMNAGLEETISGIEVVKASAREMFERMKFRHSARVVRNYFVQQGEIEARYLPLLLYGITVGLTFLHTMWIYQQGRIGFADIIAVMGLIAILRFPTFISVFALSLFQQGIVASERILKIVRTETDLDENAQGYNQSLQGSITFEDVSFSYGQKPVLDRVSLTVEPGQTIAIVGQTGSGKSALTQLVNRTYDATTGRVLIDGIDVRDWNLDALRSQIAKIEQDIFLFSRTLAENIAFGAPDATREQIEDAARMAQAHDFIMTFADGYDTVVGERGMTLSGGQRQRIALARAFLSNPRILILDDSTSAVDSATEDQIQQAIQQARTGRTTLLITHRLSQIRWADQILVLDQGQAVAYGTHDELLRRSPHYRRIFARYDAVLPPLETDALQPV